MQRPDQRSHDSLRKLSFRRGFIGSASGSCLVESGRTRVICTATVEEAVPPWLQGRGTGWVTAEYAMLPAATGRRKPRDVQQGRRDGRTVEIQRLVGRALRPAVDMALLGERSVILDCDVIEADGGTRTTAINGAWLALKDALDGLRTRGTLKDDPLRLEVAAVSVGVVNGEVLLDLAYQEDARAEADLNVVMTGDGEFIEIQGTGESRPFTRSELERALELARDGIAEIIARRRAVLEHPLGTDLLGS